MVKVKLGIVILLLSLNLIACQHNNPVSGSKNLNLRDDVTSIEVYEWDREELITVIDDQELIKNLVNELENANTHTTEHIDWALPEYELLFIHHGDVLYEIGYCKEVQNFGNGAVGRYWEFDQLYGVSTKLQVIEIN